MKYLGYGFLAIIIVGIMSVVGVFLGHMNAVPVLDTAVTTASSQVDNQYQRRNDLIPNLVEVVKGFAKHETEVFVGVADARSKASQVTLTPETLKDPQAMKAYQEAQAQMKGALSRLLAVSERYPELKSDKNFLGLQAQLEGTENRIATARGDLIKAIKNYNLEIKTIPGKWVAAIMYPDATEKQNFTATEEAKTTPKVKF